MTCVRALALAFAFAIAGAPSASASTTITSGVLTNELGVPTSGTVRIYAVLPHGGTSPLLGTAKAAAGGRFTVKATNPAQLVELAASQRGFLDWWAVADTGGFEGAWASTSYIDDTGGRVRSVKPDAVALERPRAARVSALAPAPDITLRAKRPVPARMSQGHCRTKHEERVTDTASRLVIVGELNNAYNDGTSARFIYGRGGSSATWFGLAVDNGDGSGFHIDSEKFASYSGTSRFPTVHRRFARKMRSGFVFERRLARNNNCAVWDVYVRPIDWQGTQNTKKKQRGTLNKCDPAAFGYNGFLSGGGFETTNASAVRWSKGASVFGAELTTRSGFDDHVQITYNFRGRKGKRHYLCGPDGRQSPYRAGRIFSGAIKR